MRVEVSDTSCVIDLHLADLLKEFVCLPHTIVFPEPLFEYEALSITPAEKNRLLRLGLEVWTIPGPGVERAQRLRSKHPRLKLHDCFALVVAEDTDNAVLLTSDKNLKNVAQGRHVDSHGVLWATDEIFSHALCDAAKLRAAMKLFLEHPLVFIPDTPIQDRIRRYK
jgi:hypothetical protein